MTKTRSFQQYLERGKHEHGAKFSADNLAPQFVAAYEHGERITVEFVGQDGAVYDVRRCTIGATTGWKPCFLLMHNSRSIGSPYTLSSRDRITTMERWREWQREQKAA